MTSQFRAMNTSGPGAFVLETPPGSLPRCVAEFQGPDAFEQAAKRARELNRNSAPAKVGG